MTADETSDHVDEARSTAPQSPFSSRAVLIGALVFLVGLVIVGVIPLLGTL